MEVLFEPMSMDHYDEVTALWQASENVGLSSADERERIETYLARNPDMSLVAKVDDCIVGAALCGHDGRRGYLHHLVVKKPHRKTGIGRRLVDKCMESLKNDGILKCHLFVFNRNEEGKAFWEKIGWSPRSDIRVVSKQLDTHHPLDLHNEPGRSGRYPSVRGDHDRHKKL